MGMKYSASRTGMELAMTMAVFCGRERAREATTLPSKKKSALARPTVRAEEAA